MDTKQIGEKNMAADSLSVVIIGGSITGLMHAIMLHSLGHKVHVIEQSPSASRSDHAAGITAQSQVVEYFSRYGFSQQKWSVPCPGVQFLDAKAHVKRFIKKPLEMTSWNVLYDHLMHKIDSLSKQDGECLKAKPSTPTCTFGTRAINVAYENDEVVIDCENLSGGEQQTLRANLVIAADGAGSNIRRSLLPQSDREYSGYIAWRGTVTEDDISTQTREVLGNRLTYFSMWRSYILCYLIPGETGSLDPGKRRLNWVWYCNYADGSWELDDVMSDCNNHRHRNTLPAGKMRAEVWSMQKSHAAKVMNPPFLELVMKTAEPFVSVVNDVNPKQASLFDHKLLFAGEALALIRPHLALSTNQSAMNCLQLEKALKGETTMAEWERTVLQYAVKSQAVSNAFGTYFQSDSWTFARNLLWLLWVLLAQPVRNVWPF